MNVIRYNNFTEFFQSMNPEFAKSSNERLKSYFQVVANLSKGCGCTRRKRQEYSSKEYRSMSQILNTENIQLMKMKYPMTKFEFAEANEVFHVIEL